MTSNTHSDIFDIATKLLKDHLYAEALSFLEQADDSAPPKFLYARMRCLLKLGRTQEAQTCCLALEKLHGDSRVAFATGKLSEDRTGPSDNVVAGMALLCALEHAARLFRQEHYEDALAVLEEEDGRSQPEWVYARARCLGKLGRYDDALVCCTALTQEHRDSRGEVLAQKLQSEKDSLSAPVRRRIQSLIHELERARKRDTETAATLEAANADRESLRKELASREAALAESERRLIEAETALRKIRLESQRTRVPDQDPFPAAGPKTAPQPDALLRDKYEILRVGMDAGELVDLLGHPNRVGNMDDLLRDGLPPPPSLALSGNVQDMVAHFKSTEVWTYEGVDGTVKLDLTGGRIARIHPLLSRS